jgi:hypothetical protein
LVKDSNFQTSQNSKIFLNKIQKKPKKLKFPKKKPKKAQKKPENRNISKIIISLRSFGHAWSRTVISIKAKIQK